MQIIVVDEKQRSSGTEPRLHHGNFGMYKEATDILQTLAIVPRVKGSYYVVNRVLYSYMYDYATSVYEKKKICCINTEISRFITTAFPQTVATTPHYSSGIINRKGQEDQSLQRLLAIFPTISLSQIEPVLPTSFLMPIIKERQEERKDG
jgi:hypothetical protein